MIWIGDQLVTLAPPPRKLTPEEAHAPAIERGAKCTSCPLFGCGRGPVLPTIREGAPLIAIGEAPSENEVRERRGFVGASGQVLDESLREGGLSRSDISVSNVLLCQPPDGGGFTDYIENLKLEHARKMRAWAKRWAPEATRDRQEEEAFANFNRAPNLLDAPPQLVLPQECCRPRLEMDLRESNSRVVLAVGKQALDVCSDIFDLKKSKKPASLKKQHGAPVMLGDGRILISSYHPSFAFRGKRGMMPIIRMNIARAAKIAARGGQIDWTVPDFYIFQSKERFLQILRVFHETGAEVTVDIETNSKDPHKALIYCVGIGAVIDGKEVIAIIPFNRKDGTPWWSEDDKIEVALALRAVLDDNPLVFQNGNYDVTALLRVGLMTAKDKTHTDTLILHNNSIWNDLPHDLGFIARQYFEAPLWKKDVDHKTTSVTTDAELYYYNALDVLVTMRAVVELRKEIEKAETHAQLRTDIGNLPRIRQMSELGVFVNEWHRSELSEMLNRKCFQIEREFCDVVGVKINPRSVPQLQDLLFGKWKYEPVLATDGFEWDAEEGDEVEDAATSSAALTSLMKERRIDPMHALALNKLLAFRAYDKIRGTYVDNLPTYPLDLSAFGHVPWADRVVGPKYDDATERIWVRTILPKRPGLSLARTTYKNHITPSGRLASGDPLNLQNIPARGRGGLNLRDMFVAPPGHCFVGSDYQQIEARIYAVVAQDEMLLWAIEQGLDIHTLNAASLLQKPGQDVMDVYRWINKQPPEEKKYFRTVAKRFCIIRDTPILTDCGLVAIQDVTTAMRVWDGVEWVEHDGVVFNGFKEVITYQGLTATPDHKVWLANGETCTFEEAAESGARLAQTGAGRYSLRFVDYSRRSYSSRPQGARKMLLRRRARRMHSYARERYVDSMLDMRESKSAQLSETPNDDFVANRDHSRHDVSCLDRHRQSVSRRSDAADHGSSPMSMWLEDRYSAAELEAGHIMAMSTLCKSQSDTISASSAFVERTSTMSGRSASDIQELRRTGDRVPLRIYRGSGNMDRREHRLLSRTRPRPYRQRWALRTREHSVGYATRERTQSPTAASTSKVLMPVYDILNAGPRRRFTAANYLISNCFLKIYGGQKEKLFSVMMADRDKATGELTFPKLTEKECWEWSDNWDRTHPWTMQWHRRCHDAYETYGFAGVPAIDFRRRYFPGGVDQKNAIPNLQIQGLAASITNQAMARLIEAVPFRGWSSWSGVCLQVHDFLAAYVPVERAEEAKGLVYECMDYHWRGMHIAPDAPRATWNWGAQ